MTVSGERSRTVPVVAALLALAYAFAATVAAALLAVAAVMIMLAACAIVLARRRSRGLVASLVVIGVWLGLGLVGVWVTQGAPTGGLLWVVLGLFLVPLPLVPWLYAWSFSSAHGPRPTAHASPKAPE